MEGSTLKAVNYEGVNMSCTGKTGEVLTSPKKDMYIMHGWEGKNKNMEAEAKPEASRSTPANTMAIIAEIEGVFTVIQMCIRDRTYFVSTNKDNSCSV